MNRLFCFGLGYSARALARRLKTKGWRVAGTTRTQVPAERGYENFIFAPGVPLSDPSEALHGTTHVLVSIPPDTTGDPVLTRHSHDLSVLKPSLQWIGYLSTTAVYGDHSGGWVDEQTPLTPTSERAKRRVAAEHAWTEFCNTLRVPLHIFRLAGIYGPGRNQIEALRKGTARRVMKAGQVYSRIHVEDLASVLEASIAQPNAGAIYNVCDDEPAPAHEVIEYAARLLNMPAPPLEPFDEAAQTMSEMALSFYTDSKRVRNDRIKAELGVRLRYPTYREGLKSLLR